MKRGLQKSFPQVRKRILGLFLLMLLFFHAYSSLLVSAFSQEENVTDKRILQRFVQQEVLSRLGGFRSRGSSRGGRGRSPGGGRGGGGGSKGRRGGSPGGGCCGGNGNESSSNGAAGGRSSNRSAAKVAFTLYALLVLASLLVITNN